MNFEDEAMSTLGYFGHMIPSGDEETSTGCNFHTHGFWHSWRHPDIQIVISLPKDVAGPLFESAKEIAVRGGQILINKKYNSFLVGFDVEFAWASECNRDVLRLILPDKNNITANGMIADPYSHQWIGTTETTTQGTYTQYTTDNGAIV